MKTTCLLFLTMSWAALMRGTGYAVPSSSALRLSKLESSLSSQGGSAAPLCGKPMAFRPGLSISFFPRRLEGAAFQTTRRTLVKVQAPRKGEAFPHSGAAEPLVSNVDAGRAASPREQEHPEGGEGSDEQRNHGRASGSNNPANRVSLTRSNRPKALPNWLQHSLPGNALHQTGLCKPGSRLNGGLIQGGTVHRTLPVQTSSVVRPATPSLNNLRHRSPNPAVVGGSPNLHSSNAGAINGARMNRKP